MAYVGDTRSRKLLAKLRRFGIGQIIIRGRLRGRRLDRWAYDNGAFEDWRKGRDFDAAQFISDLREMMATGERPDWIVLPDRVADRHSGDLSKSWLRRLNRLGLTPAPFYFAVQDGMASADVPWDEIAGIFVGGTLDWKRRAVANWAALARKHGIKCHYARCGTARRIAQAKALGYDSLDSCLPLWSRENCASFLGALDQVEMFSEV